MNTAEGKGFGMVNTSKDYYRDTNIKYMGIQLLDLPVANISMHFEETAAFIENGVKRGGKFKFSDFFKLRFGDCIRWII